MTTVADASSSSGAKSNQYRSNAFFTFVHDGNPKTITVEYSGGSSGTPYNDIDLFLYKKDYIYQETGAASTGSVVVSSARAYGIETGAETINLTNLAAGTYLINVKAYTFGKITAQLGGTMNYRMKITQSSTTEDLCPAN
jgi:Bacterial pre-peptidase C-terminal domain